MSKKLEQLFENFMISEGRAPGTPSIKRYKRPDGTTALKSLNKWGKRKDWRDTEGGLAKAREHAGVDEVTEGLKDPEDNPCWKGYEPVGTKKKNGKTVPNCVPVSEEVPCAEPISSDPNDPTSRLIGTDSIVKVYKKATPGQDVVQENVLKGIYNLYQKTKGVISQGASRLSRSADKGSAPNVVRPNFQAKPRQVTPPPARPKDNVIPMQRPAAPKPSAPTPAATPAKPSLVRRAANATGKAAGTVAGLAIAGSDVGDKRFKEGKSYTRSMGEVGAATAAGAGAAALLARRRGLIAKGLAAGGGYLGADALMGATLPQPAKPMNESFEMAFDYQGKPQLAPTAGELRMQAKGAFAHHTDVQNVMDVKDIKESIQKQFELTVLEEDTEQLASKCEVLMDMVEHALDTIATIKESTVERDAWAEAQILKLESYILSVSKYIDNILGEDSVPVIRRSYMRTDPRTGERKRVRGRTYKRRRDFADDEDDKQDMPKGPLSV